MLGISPYLYAMESDLSKIKQERAKKILQEALNHNKIGELERAKEEYIIAAELGNADVQFSVAAIFEGASLATTDAQIKQKNLDMAKRYYEMAANQGHSLAQLHIGSINVNFKEPLPVIPAKQTDSNDASNLQEKPIMPQDNSLKPLPKQAPLLNQAKQAAIVVNQMGGATQAGLERADVIFRKCACGYVAPLNAGKEKLYEHVREHKEGRSYKCPIVECGKLKKTARYFICHIAFKHTKEKPFKCTKCDRSFVRKDILLRHENIFCHWPEQASLFQTGKEDILQVSENISLGQKGSDKSNEVNTILGKETYPSNQLLKRKSEIVNKISRECACGYIASEDARENLKEHIKSKHSVYKCPVFNCNIIEVVLEDFMRHIAVHAQAKPLKWHAASNLAKQSSIPQGIDNPEIVILDDDLGDNIQSNKEQESASGLLNKADSSTNSPMSANKRKRDS